MLVYCIATTPSINTYELIIFPHITYSSSTLNPACLKWPLALRLFPPTTLMHHLKNESKPWFRYSS